MDVLIASWLSLEISLEGNTITQLMVALKSMKIILNFDKLRCWWVRAEWSAIEIKSYVDIL